MSRFLTSKYKTLEPYTPGEQPRDTRYIKLNTNESPFPPAPSVIEAVRNEAYSQNLYPDPTGRLLALAIADANSVSEQNVALGNGSDELLAFTFMAFCGHGVCFPDISYGFYPVYAEFTGVNALKIPLGEDYSINPEDYFDAKRTVLIANPNAPTGMALSREQVEQIVLHNLDELVVIDEAYVDFGAESAVPLIKRYDNLLIIGTYSKSRSLAGARLGYAIGGRELIADMNKMRYSFNPYNVNRLALAAGRAATLDTEYFKRCVSEICRVREWASHELKELGFTVFPSCANFVFAKLDSVSGEELYLRLKAKGVLVRHFTGQRLSEYVRISIGTEDDMRTLIQKIEEIIAEEKR